MASTVSIGFLDSRIGRPTMMPSAPSSKRSEGVICAPSEIGSTRPNTSEADITDSGIGRGKKTKGDGGVMLHQFFLNFRGKMADGRPRVASDNFNRFPILLALILAPRIGPIPIGGPLPDISDHVQCAVRTLPGGIMTDRGQILGLPADIGFLWIELISPRVSPPVGSPRRFFPFRLGGEPSPLPMTVIFRLLPTHHHHRIALAPF